MRLHFCVLFLLLLGPVAYGTSHHYGHHAQTYHAKAYSSHPNVRRDSHGRIKRSTAAKNAFKHEHPCPSTGRSSGSCPGYVIYHFNPIECGGADAPFNMQADGRGGEGEGQDGEIVPLDRVGTSLPPLLLPGESRPRGFQ
jgi:hypothetical protein